MKHSLIGILAGMGPRSTAPFLEKVLDQCQIQYGAADDKDFPPIMLYSLPTPFYANRPIDHGEMEKTIIRGLQKLERSGVRFIAMPCNSAHIYYDKLCSSISIPLLNLIEIATEKLPTGRKRVALLGTQTTIEAGLYQNQLEKKGMGWFHDATLQNYINEILADIKSKNDIGSAAKRWQQLIEYLLKQEIDVMLSACTDLQTASRQTLPQQIPVMDAADCLAEAVVRRWVRSRKEK